MSVRYRAATAMAIAALAVASLVGEADAAGKKPSRKQTRDAHKTECTFLGGTVYEFENEIYCVLDNTICVMHDNGERNCGKFDAEATEKPAPKKDPKHRTVVPGNAPSSSATRGR